MVNSVRHSDPLRVLLVEDSLVNQKLLIAMLDLRNCVVTVAVNGQEALNRMAEDEFDVVLMDVEMPVMDGLTATRLIRDQEAGTTRHIPILAVTAGIDRQTCLEAGMDEHLEKPPRQDSLNLKLDQLLTGGA